MASPSVPAKPTPTASSLRRQRRRLALMNDIAVIAVVALFVVGAIVIGLAELHAGLTGH